MPVTLRLRGGLLVVLLVVLAGFTLDAASLAQVGRQPVRQNVQQDVRQGADLSPPIYRLNRETGLILYNRSAAFGDSSNGMYSRYSREAFGSSSGVGRSGAFGPRQGARPTGLLAVDQTRRTSPRPSYARRPPSHTMYTPGYSPRSQPSRRPGPSAAPPRRSAMAAPTYSATRQNTRVSSNSYRVRP